MTGGSQPSFELTAGDSAVLFTKLLDRFEHHFLVRIGDQRVSLMDSFLQDPTASWPTDPAIQQLVLEPIGSERYPQVALGVGMSGHGHWSLAAQWIEATEPFDAAMQFDYACKQQPPVEFLGSTYRIAKELASVGLVCNRMDCFDQRWEGWFEAAAAGMVYKLSVEVLEGRLSWHADSGQLQITPLGSFEKPSTMRWCYRIAWVSCHE